MQSFKKISIDLYRNLYQLPLLPTALLHVDLINVAYIVSHGTCLYHVIMTLHIFSDIVNDVESTQKSIITSKLLVWRVIDFELKRSCSPPLGNFADISYLEENFKPHLLRDVCTLCSGALVSDSLLHMLL